MPSAEAQPDAQVSASYSQFGNTQRRNFTFQVLPLGVGDAALLDDQRLRTRPTIPTTTSSTAASTCSSSC